jgi:hypothetical protein
VRAEIPAYASPFTLRRDRGEVWLDGFAATHPVSFILFVTSRDRALLGEHLAVVGVPEAWRRADQLNVRGRFARCVLRNVGGGEETVRARYLVGCDGAHSAVRKQARIAFEGDAYLQDFMLGDVDAEGPIETDVLHSFAATGHVAMFFPLRSPAKWRVIALGPRKGRARQAKEGHQSEESLTRGEFLGGTDLRRPCHRNSPCATPFG